MFDFNNILSLLIWLPIITGCLWLWFYNKYFEKTTVVLAVFNVFLSIVLLKNFDLTIYGWQFIEHYTMLPELGVCYSLGIDGLALILITLSSLINLVIMLSDFKSDFDCGKYKAYLLILNGMVNGVLSSTNAILFYIFFEGMLFPLFLIIGSSKTSKSIYAALKFFLYTFLGSVLFLLAIIYLRKITISSGIPTFKSLDLTNFYLLKLDLTQQIYLFLAFFIVCSVKIPLLPCHSWLPDAHVEAPTLGSMFLSGLVLKIGSFAMLRFLLPLTYDACCLFNKFIIWILLISILYIGFITLIQKNFKRLIAYYSIIHMAFVTLGMIIGVVLIKNQELGLATISLTGAMFQMLSHGFISTGMFFALGVLRDRLYSYEIKEIKGIIYSMPVFSGIFMIFCLAYISLPGTAGFVGEFLIILSSFKINILYGSIAATGLILPVSYILWNYKKIMFDKFKDKNVNFIDLTIKELTILLILIGFILFLGVYPAPILNILNNSVVGLMQIMEHK